MIHLKIKYFLFGVVSVCLYLAWTWTHDMNEDLHPIQNFDARNWPNEHIFLAAKEQL